MKPALGSFFQIVLAVAVFLQVQETKAAEQWVEVDHGAFRVFSPNGPSAARIRMGQLEQFQYAFGLVTGVKDARLTWPLELVLDRNASSGPALSRASLLATAPENGPLPAALLRNITRLFIEDNLKRLPPDLDAGLIALFSTLESEGPHIRLGAPPAAPQERTTGWGLLEMLVTDENTRGELHVFLYNLQQGASRNAACRGAFEQPCQPIEERLTAYMQTGSFAPAQFSGAPVDPRRDYRADPLDANDVAMLQADSALAEKNPDAGRLYQNAHAPEADAGAGLAALAAGNKAAARASFESSISRGSKSARAYLEAGILETDLSKKHGDLTRAAELNPRWAEPHYQMSLAARNPAHQIAELEKAVALEPRNLAWWRKLAGIATSSGDFQAAAKAWTGASLAARTDAERAELLEARADMEQQRSDAIEAERQRERAAEAAQLERVKQHTLAEIHAAEKNADQTMNANDSAPVSNPVPFSSLDSAGLSFEGDLLGLDCRSDFAIVSIQGDDGKAAKLVIGNPASVGLSCGPQKIARKIIVQYKPGANRRLGTIGEVTTVQFP